MVPSDGIFCVSVLLSLALNYVEEVIPNLNIVLILSCSVALSLKKLILYFKICLKCICNLRSISWTLISANAFGKWISWHQFCWSCLILAWLEIHLGCFRLWFYFFFPQENISSNDLNKREHFICYSSRLYFEVQLKSGDKLFTN